MYPVHLTLLTLVDNNWDEFFAFDSKSPDLPAPKQSVITPKRTTPAATRKPTPVSPLHRRRSNLRDYMGNNTTAPPDDDDWDKDFEGGLTLRSPQLASVPIPPLPPLSPRKTPSSPRKLSPPKSLTAGNISDDNSKTIRPAPFTRPSQSRKVSAESNVSSNSNGSTMRAVSMSPSPLQTRIKPAPKISTGAKKRSKGRKPSREESSDDGYEDLVKGDERKFAQKINSLKVLSLSCRC
jgi:hypothetical protein